MNKTNVLDKLAAAVFGTIMLMPPNLWAEGIGTAMGYIIPEILLAVLFAILAAITAGAGSAGLALRLTQFVAKIKTTLSSMASAVGSLVLKVFSTIEALSSKLIDLIKALRGKTEETAQGATGVVTSVVMRRFTAKFVPDIRDHIQFRDLSVPRKRGIGGAHDLDEFTKALKDEGGQIVSRTPHPSIKGVETMYYKLGIKDARGQLTGQLSNKDPYIKTVYDPNEISIDQMMKWGQEAADDAINQANGTMPYEWSGVSSDGIHIVGNANTEKNLVTTFYPDM